MVSYCMRPSVTFFYSKLCIFCDFCMLWHTNLVNLVWLVCGLYCINGLWFYLPILVQVEIWAGSGLFLLRSNVSVSIFVCLFAPTCNFVFRNRIIGPETVPIFNLTRCCQIVLKVIGSVNIPRNSAENLFSTQSSPTLGITEALIFFLVLWEWNVCVISKVHAVSHVAWCCYRRPCTKEHNTLFFKKISGILSEGITYL